ncbi:MAG: hypothetical protein IKK70_04865 [Clostridia bacterium]|nr:hypothetical protein [Clostridia bacterium]
MKKNGFLWWTGRNKSKSWNFTITTPNESLCVKMIGVRSKRILYGFVDEERYEIKDYTFALAHTMDSFEYVLKPKERYVFEENATPCIVMIPESVKVTVRSSTSQRSRSEIGNNDQTPEGRFYLSDKFIAMLKENTVD